MRTNIEDDVIASGRLGAFARAAQLLQSALPDTVKEELMAMGALTFAWRDSQMRRFTTGARERLRIILSVRFGVVTDQVIDALLVADLADLRKDKIRIKGNREHVTRLKLLRSKSSNGGKIRARSATRGKDGTFNPAQHQVSPAVSSAPAPAPAPTINTNTARTRASARGGAARDAQGTDHKRAAVPGYEQTKEYLQRIFGNDGGKA